MLSLILASLAVSSVVGTTLFFDDFEGHEYIERSPNWNYSYDPTVKVQQKPLNAEIIPCASMSDGSRAGNCMHLTKRDIGGGAFTAKIPYPTNGEKIFVEFQYYAVNYDGKTNLSSLCVGYTNNIISGFVWSACGNTSMDFTQSSPSGQPIVEIIDGFDEWKIVRFQVDPIDKTLDYFKQDPNLVIVFEDWLGVNEKTQAPGLYLIDDVVVYQGNLCPTDCQLCSNYFTCILCDPGKVYLNEVNMCFDDESCLQPFSINSTKQIDGNIVQSDSDQFILNMGIDGYDFDGCFEVLLEAGDKQDLSIPFTILTNDSSRIAAPFSLGNDCDSTDSGYECLFTLSFYAENTRIFQRQFIFSLTQQIGGNYSNFTIQRSQKVNTSTTVQIPVKTDVVVCSYAQGQQSCDGVSTQTSFQRGDIFMITLKITDSQFTSYYLGKGTVQQLGQGTNFPLTIISVYPTQGQISYVVQAQLVTNPSQITIVTANLVQPKTGRRILEKTSTLNKSYLPSGTIGLTITSEQFALQLAFFLFGILLLI